MRKPVIEATRLQGNEVSLGWVAGSLQAPGRDTDEGVLAASGRQRHTPVR
jgi:hypothetical protein